MNSGRITGAIMPYLDLILTETLSTQGLVDRYTYLHYKVCYLTPVRDSTLGWYEPIFSACTCRFNGFFRKKIKGLIFRKKSTCITKCNKDKQENVALNIRHHKDTVNSLIFTFFNV